MNKFVNQKSLRLATALIFILMMVSACGGSASSNAADDITITLSASPPGEAAPYLVVTVEDKDGQPVTGATVTVEGNMNHAGMVPVLADPVRDDEDGAADGVYRIPFQFTMLGDWIITVSVEQPGGLQTEQNIEATVSEQGVTIR